MELAQLIRQAIERSQAPTITPPAVRPEIERHPGGEVQPPAPPPDVPVPEGDATPPGRELEDFHDPEAHEGFNVARAQHGLLPVGPTLRQLNIANAENSAPLALGDFASQFAGGQGPRSYSHSLRPERGTLKR